MPESSGRKRLCRIEELSDPGTRGFTLRTAGGLQDIFIVRRGAAVHAYLNHCPHTGSPLDWQPDRFLNLDGTLIQCATHSALFRIEDGFCVAGPCAGRALTSVSVALTDGWVEVDAEAVL
ncbi:MAG TPA: Rieske (2Fe-2S) protein [Gammaproteobacteria bacterium]